MTAWLPLLTVASSLLPGLLIFFLAEDRVFLRSILNLAGAVLKLVLVAWMLVAVYGGETLEIRLPFAPGLELMLHATALPLLFVTLSAVLWLLTTLYAIGYLEHAPNRSRFFGFFSLCVSAATGVALAGNLFSFVLFYEALTLATWPLVVHRGTERALHAGRVYLAYTLGGGVALLAGAAWLHVLAGPVEFIEGGALGGRPDLDPDTLRVIFYVLLAGLGVKASLVPLHGWLPVAMVAPAPVSALLHAVAVVKAGAFGIVRVISDVYGFELALDLGITTPLALLAGITIVWGSLRALQQRTIKRRLAFSTVSQVSYIALGVALSGPIGVMGGLVHLVHQGIMKITLFFCAGNLAEILEVHRLDQLRGVGRRMPWTMGAFSLAALGMIGVPPMAGFVSKWLLGVGAWEVGQLWVIGVLVLSSALNAAYFLPPVVDAWRSGGDWQAPRGPEAPWLLLGPTLVTAALILAMGLFALTEVSPLAWVRLIVAREPGP